MGNDIPGGVDLGGSQETFRLSQWGGVRLPSLLKGISICKQPVQMLIKVLIEYGVGQLDIFFFFFFVKLDDLDPES